MVNNHYPYHAAAIETHETNVAPTSQSRLAINLHNVLHISMPEPIYLVGKIYRCVCVGITESNCVSFSLEFTALLHTHFTFGLNCMLQQYHYHKYKMYFAIVQH